MAVIAPSRSGTFPGSTAHTTWKALLGLFSKDSLFAVGSLVWRIGECLINGWEILFFSLCHLTTCSKCNATPVLLFSLFYKCICRHRNPWCLLLSFLLCENHFRSECKSILRFRVMLSLLWVFLHTGNQVSSGNLVGVLWRKGSWEESKKVHFGYLSSGMSEGRQFILASRLSYFWKPSSINRVALLLLLPSHFYEGSLNTR